MNTIRIGLEKVQEAVQVRGAITERYATYKELSQIVQAAAMVEHADFKNAVDALYYLGGGWPTENSKGRMEKLLDNFSGMYRVLSLIDKGHLVEEHLAKKGIKVTLMDPIADVQFSEGDIRLLNEDFGMKQFGFEPATLAALVAQCVDEAQKLQAFICKNADKIKDELKPMAKGALGVEDEEYDRIFYLTKFADKPERVVKKKNGIEGSVVRFKQASATHL